MLKMGKLAAAVIEWHWFIPLYAIGKTKQRFDRAEIRAGLT